ncbi:unnamed protein product [Cuscuta campestris]|uniref:F-box domain-containing protein n=1 Tax=Cuscuta campestris TaxID=132261 RepID=A0A484L4W7_9ASTE|nr:unnamed protein product [Cuscuta campestris]
MEFECQDSIETGLLKNIIDRSDISVASRAEYKYNLSGSSNYTLDSDSGKAALKSNAEDCVSVPNGTETLPSRRSINDLPQALVSEILGCLEPKELGIVSCVNASLYQIASEHQGWKEFYRERWGDPALPIALGPEGSDLRTKWKDLFVQREFRSKTFLGRYTVDTLYGHTEEVRTVFVLASKKLVFTSGYDQIVRMWDLEEGLSLSYSRPLGCTVRAVTADSKLLLAGGTRGFIYGWRAEEGNPNLFDLKGPQNQNREFRLWEHLGPVTCLAVVFNKIYSGSWDMSVRVWDCSSLKCLIVLMHNDWVWSLAPHDDTTVATTSGPDVYLWDTKTGTKLSVANNAHVGNAHSLARSHTGKLIFTGGEDGAIHMFEVVKNIRFHLRKVATWNPHSGHVYSLAFEFPWLVSASSDGKLALIDVRKLLKTRKCSENGSSSNVFSRLQTDPKSVEPPQRMLHGFGPNLFAVDIGLDRIVCAGEDGAVRIWNFSQALEIEERVRTLRGLRLENRMMRRKLQCNMNNRGGGRRGDQCSVAAKKNQINGDRNSWQNKRRASWKVKA